MGVWGRGSLSAAAAGLLALGSGCLTTDKAKNEPKKPDVTQPGVLPPPLGITPTGAAQPGAPGGGVVQASGTQLTASAVTMPKMPNVPSFARLTGKGDKGMLASEMALGWQPRIAYLPDQTRNGAMGPGLVGQMFLYGGPHLHFAEANGTLTIDMIDVTPRPAGQPAATPERWQFTKEVLKNLVTVDETFGKSYVLFLPWRAYNPTITRVQLSARYDQEHRHPLYSMPSTITIDTTAPFGAPVWSDHKSVTTPLGMPAPGGMQPPGGRHQPPSATPPVNLAPIPIGGAAVQPGAGPVPGAMMPVGPVKPLPLPEGLEPIGITAGRP